MQLAPACHRNDVTATCCCRRLIYHCLLPDLLFIWREYQNSRTLLTVSSQRHPSDAPLDKQTNILSLRRVPLDTCPAWLPSTPPDLELQARSRASRRAMRRAIHSGTRPRLRRRRRRFQELLLYVARFYFQAVQNANVSVKEVPGHPPTRPLPVVSAPSRDEDGIVISPT